MTSKERRVNAIGKIGKDLTQWLIDNWDSFKTDKSIVSDIPFHEGDIRRIVKVVEVKDDNHDTFISMGFAVELSSVIKSFPDKIESDEN